MKAEELRKGNLVKDRKGNTVLVKEVLSLGINTYYETVEYKYNKIQPIPITEEWLIKVGAEEWPHKKYRKFKIGMLMIGSTNNMETFSIVNLNMKHFKYQHEFQNLYFALTGEELIN